MEIFASLKTMNKQTQIRAFVAALVLLGAAWLAPQAQAQNSGDKIAVNLSDPSRPPYVKVSMVNGSINVKAYDGKQVVVEARNRSEDRERESTSGGLKRLNISTT